MKKFMGPLAVAALITVLGAACGGVERENDSTTECERALVVNIDSFHGGSGSCVKVDGTSWSTTFPAGASFGFCADKPGAVMTLTLNGSGSITVREVSNNALFPVRFRLPNGTELETARLQLPVGGTVTLTVP